MKIFFIVLLLVNGKKWHSSLSASKFLVLFNMLLVHSLFSSIKLPSDFWAVTLVSTTFFSVCNNPVLKHLFTANLIPAFPSKLFSSRSLHSHTLCLFFQLDAGGGTQGETAEPHRSPPVRPDWRLRAFRSPSFEQELVWKRLGVRQTLKALKYACLRTNAPRFPTDRTYPLTWEILQPFPPILIRLADTKLTRWPRFNPRYREKTVYQLAHPCKLK